MKKKEVLIIFLLAVLITLGSGFIAHNPCSSCRDAFYDLGWPLIFHRTGGFFGVNQWFWPQLVSDFLFWSLVLAVGWWARKILMPRAVVVKWVKGRFLREITFRENKDENVGGFFWNIVFLASIPVATSLGLDVLVPWQIALSSLFGIYSAYRNIKYNAFLDPSFLRYPYLRRERLARWIGVGLLIIYLEMLVFGLFGIYHGSISK